MKEGKTMSTVYEITPDDVLIVAAAHGVTLENEQAEQLCNELDHDEIEKGLLHYCDLGDQTDSCYDDIEDVLLKKGIITGDKAYFSPAL